MIFQKHFAKIIYFRSATLFPHLITRIYNRKELLIVSVKYAFYKFLFQTRNAQRCRFADDETGRVSVPLPGTGRLHQCNSVVRRNRRLSVRRGRGLDPLLHNIQTAAGLPVLRFFNTPASRHSNLCDSMEDVQKTTALDTANSSEKSLLRHCHRWRERRNLLTQRQFCTLRWSRQSDDRVTVHPGAGSGTRSRQRNAQNWQTGDWNILNYINIPSRTNK